jgi:tRNA threonylcarbamoyladenosine biosynthesis protein TsaE
LITALEINRKNLETISLIFILNSINLYLNLKFALFSLKTIIRCYKTSLIMPSYTIHNKNELQSIAGILLPYITKKPVVAFYGKMGVGKTTLIKAICKEINVINVVTSPTFTLVNEYLTKSGDKVYHFDFYRINEIEEIYDFGYEEYFYSGHFCLIEWPELAESILPQYTLCVTITENKKGSRKISFPD